MRDDMELTEFEAAEFLDLSETDLRQKRQRGEACAFITRGQKISYRLCDLKEWRDMHKKPSQPRAFMGEVW